MTTPHYANTGCAAGSQEPGEAWSSDYAWIVNFDNGNSDNNHRDNNAFVRAVRSVSSGECQGDMCVPLRDLHRAWQAARKGKKPSVGQLDFDSRWADQLLQLQRELEAGTWAPSAYTSFVATRPKAREIHAPHPRDRVVHHWMVPQLEAVYERTFIHDSYANRIGKGVHAAVRALQAFVRQTASGEGGGWYLKLDIHNFFPSIHRETLWRLLKPRLQRDGVARPLLLAAHALLRHAPTHAGVRQLATPEEIALVPPHKRLANAAPGCGLPIGNLPSQFLANVYMDRFDQFAKHQLKARRYLRYVDDFVLVHRDRAQLEAWLPRIERFLADELRLRLKPEIELRPLASGIDFLGYVVYPTHTRVRRRVIAHARAALADWQRRHVHDGAIHATPADLAAIRSTWASYEGHLQHANAHRLHAQIHARFPWLASAVRPRRFAAGAMHQPHTIRLSTYRGVLRHVRTTDV